ncbi:MAG TPA: O-antigen ligase family protein [Gaiellaceae bacterium]|nr:O-antigen ligase family protein [Gaiellaceae bacterium]
MAVNRESFAALGVFTLVATLGFDSGGYAATAWGWSAIALFAVLTVLIARGIGRPGRAAVVFVGALAGLAVWIAASLIWSSDVSATVLEVQRALVYIAAAALFVLAGRGSALLTGVLGAATLLCGYGLANWLLGNPEVPASADPQSAGRLSEPIGYANGVAILAAMGLLLSVGFAARASRAPAAAAAAATAPLFAATLYFTFGRGAWLALAVGLGVAVAIGPGRLQLAAAALALAVPGAIAVVSADLLGASGWLAALVVLLCALASAVPYVLRSTEARYRPSVRVRRAFAAALIALPVVAVAAVLVRLGGPAAAYDSFKAAPAPTHGDVQGRVFSLSGSNRADYWRVAWRVYEDHPALGAGAGTYSRSWLRERPVPQPVQDAHSLYLETLAELGPIGLALLLIALAAPFAAPRSWWTPVALGPYVAFLAHAAQDWDWELPAVTVAALACAAAPITSSDGRRIPRFLAILPATLGLLVVPGFLGNRAAAEAQSAYDRSAWRDAEDAARSARSLQPWSPEPWRLLGEAQLAQGALAPARNSFRKGLAEDPDEWELWLDLGLASEGRARHQAFEQAARLNPLSPELEELGFKSE